jgi:hypothetical protein
LTRVFFRSPFFFGTEVYVTNPCVDRLAELSAVLASPRNTEGYPPSTWVTQIGQLNIANGGLHIPVPDVVSPHGQGV